MAGPLWKNREYNSALIWQVGTLLLWAFLFMLFSHIVWESLQQDLIQRDVALLGRILHQLPPDLHQSTVHTAMQAFTGGLSPQDYQTGIGWAGEYGYHPDLPLNSTPVLGSAYRSWFWGSLLAMGALGLLLGGLLTRSLAKLFGAIHNLARGAERIVEGEFLSFPDEGEGELPLLHFQFNQMSKRLRHTLRALQSEKTFLKEMISGVSHQLKTPLASLRMYADLMEEGEDPATQREFLHETQTQLDRMEWLIQTLLSMARLEAGVIELQKDQVNIRETIDLVLEPLHLRSQAKGQSLTITEEPGLLPLRHDRKWLAEAIGNILDNAIDYTPTGGRIQIKLQDYGSSLSISITDSGEGIPPEELPLIFDRFYQSPHHRHLNRRGSGIGLSLAQLIIQKHGGAIRAESKVGQGTTFRITLSRESAYESVS